MKGLTIKIVDFKNALEAIELQRKIFPEDGLLNILASLDRDLFQKETGMYYPDDHVKYYLAYLSGQPIGITGLYYQPGDTEEMWVAWFGVLSEYRNQGYGSAILNWTMEEVVRQGRKTIRLYTDMIECKDAITLYEKLGFHGEKYSVEDLSYDCYIFSKSLINEEIPLWNNQFLGLAQQSSYEQMDDKFKEELFEKYRELYFKSVN